MQDIRDRLTALENATGALADAIRERAEIKPDVFVQTIHGFIENLDLEMKVPDTPHYEYFVGMKNAYRYALAVYEGMV